MARYIYQDTARDGAGNVVASATVSVYLNGTTTAASVYTASSGGTAVNNVTSSSDGSFYFYADTSDYSATQKFKITIAKSGYTTKTYDDLLIFPLPAPTALSVKVGTITRDMDAVSGDVSYTGVGFTPGLVFFTAAVQTTSISFGFGDATTSTFSRGWNAGGGSILFTGGSGACVHLYESSILGQDAVVKSLDSDGFTLTWSKSGSPTPATITIGYVAIG